LRPFPVFPGADIKSHQCFGAGFSLGIVARRVFSSTRFSGRDNLHYFVG
jgi:hypothetical protein